MQASADDDQQEHAEMEDPYKFFCSIFAPLSGAMEQIVETWCDSIAVC
jgi:hypothetical protein